MRDKPRIGRIVLVASDDWSGERPAIITQVWSDRMVNVAVFGDGSYDNFDVRQVTSVSHQSVAMGPSRWRWYAEDAKHYSATSSGASA